MATIQGTGGQATIAGYNAKMESWTAKLTIETADVTGFSDNGFSANRAVIASMSGSATGIAQRDAATTKPMPTLSGLASASPVAIVLTASSGNTWSFNAVVSGVSLSRPNDGKMEITFDFESSGAVTQAWS